MAACDDLVDEGAGRADGSARAQGPDPDGWTADIVITATDGSVTSRRVLIGEGEVLYSSPDGVGILAAGDPTDIREVILSREDLRSCSEVHADMKRGLERCRFHLVGGFIPSPDRALAGRQGRSGRESSKHNRLSGIPAHAWATVAVLSFTALLLTMSMTGRYPNGPISAVVMAMAVAIPMLIIASLVLHASDGDSGLLSLGLSENIREGAVRVIDQMIAVASFVFLIFLVIHVAMELPASLSAMQRI